MSTKPVYDPKNLFIGKLTDSAVSLLPEIVAGTVALVHTLHLHNSDSVTRTVTIQHFDGATVFQTDKIELTAGKTEYLSFGNEGRAFNTAHQLLALADVTNVVIADISGSIRTAPTE